MRDNSAKNEVTCSYVNVLTIYLLLLQESLNASIVELTAQLSVEKEKVSTLTAEVASNKVRSHYGRQNSYFIA